MALHTRLAVVLCCSAAVLAVLPACNNNDGKAASTSTSAVTGAGDAASKAMSALPQSVIDMGKDYIGKLGDVNSLLAGITDQASALKSIPGLAELAEPLSRLTDSLNALSPELKSQAKTAFGDKLTGVNNTFSSQASRLSGTPDIGSMLKSTLDKIKLFK